MSSVDNEEKVHETVIYRTKCHWAMVLGPILVIIIGWLALRSQGYPAYALILFGAIWGYFAYVSLGKSEIVLTRDVLSISAGFPRLKSYDVPLRKIVSIDFYQPSLGSMLNFGKIMIVDDARKRSVIRFVDSPAELVLNVRQQIAALSEPS